MNRELIDRVVKAMLYEGYLLYPYRRSALKNQRRWDFGVLFPEGHGSVIAGAESSRMQTECLIVTGTNATLRTRVRFLHLLDCVEIPSATALQPGRLDMSERRGASWQETEEREVDSMEVSVAELASRPRCVRFEFPARHQDEDVQEGGTGPACVRRAQERIEGAVDLSVVFVRDGLCKLTAQISNCTPVAESDGDNRERALPRCLISTHTILEIAGGEFVSVIDPPEGYRDATQACRNAGTWPVLVGAQDERDCMLSSPIILYDYPQVAPESAGDFFDATEIDEMLTLRVLTLSDEEKQSVREGDASAREILERTESALAEQLMKLHGALRGLR